MIHTQDQDFTLLCGDVLDELAGLPDESVHCVVTSPPYWGLRDYGTGSWAGGDPDCDHVQRATRGDAGRPATMVARGKGGALIPSGSSEPVDTPMRFRNECGKCGARRVDQQLGLEPTPEAYVARMVEVFREVRRVLRADGTCWVNLGDSYNAGTSSDRINHTTKNPNDTRAKQFAERSSGRARMDVDGLKPKDLCGIPWRVAFALQADGWYLRSDIIWAKPNPMPESVTDRPTKAHEYVFLLSKSPRYFFDAEAIREPHKVAHLQKQDSAPKDRGDQRQFRKQGLHDFVNPAGRNARTVWDIAEEQPTLDPSLPAAKQKTTGYEDKHLKSNKPGWSGNPNVHGEKGHALPGQWQQGEGRNVRSVWDIATQPYPEAHFATYPEELVRRCVLAGSSEYGCCPECGAPWERETTTAYEHVNFTAPREHSSYVASGGAVANKVVTTLGWHPGCDCVGSSYSGIHPRTGKTISASEPPEPIPCTVLDPFLGSGTTAYVARKHGRRSIGIELNPTYADLAAKRMQQQSLLV